MSELDATILQTVAWVSSITLVTVAVFFQNFIGLDWSTILLVPGVVIMTAYFTSKGLANRRPKFVAAKERLLTAIWIMAVGGAVVELSEIPVVLSPPGRFNITIMAFGIIAMIVASVLLTISLRLAKPTEPIAY